MKLMNYTFTKLIQNGEVKLHQQMMCHWIIHACSSVESARWWVGPLTPVTSPRERKVRMASPGPHLLVKYGFRLVTRSVRHQRSSRWCQLDVSLCCAIHNLQCKTSLQPRCEGSYEIYSPDTRLFFCKTFTIHVVQYGKSTVTASTDTGEPNSET